MGKELQTTNSLPEVLPKENLPAKPLLTEYPLPEWDHNSSDEEIRRIDVIQNKAHFAILADGVRELNGIDSRVKLVLALDRLQERRRHLLGIPYGADSSRKKETLVYPID